MKEKNHERKADLNAPIGYFHEKELCQYEKLRENNIKEGEQAMADFGGFTGIQKENWTFKIKCLTGI